MNLAKFFITFIFLLTFAFQISAQDKVDPNLTKQDFDSLLFGRKEIKGLKLGEITPNELAGYAFFKEGIFKGLKLGISTKENVKEIFGKDCEKYCEFNKDWAILFIYFSNITKTINELKYVPDPKFANNLYSIKIVPKNKVSFNGVVFSDDFQKFSSTAFGHDFEGNARHVAFDSYTDSYGLRYEVFDKITFSTIAEKDDRQKGDLISIEYTIPNNLEEKLFIEQK